MHNPSRHTGATGRFPIAQVCVCLASILLAQVLVFYATRPLIERLTLHYGETSLDLRIPFIPAWVTVYYLSFASWIVSAIWIFAGEPAHSYRVACAYVLAMLISGALFFIYPMTLHRPEPTGGDLFSRWVRWLYQIDSPTNLCPSLHVMASYFCWRGTFGCRHIPRWYKWFNFIFLILVCLSVLFVKQHVIVDIPAAVLIAEFTIKISEKCRLERVPLSLIARCHRR